MPARDYSAFQGRVSRQQVAEFRRRSHASGRFSSGPGGIIAVVIVGVLVLIFAGVFGTVFTLIAASASGNPALIPIPVVAVVILAGAVAIISVFAARARWERRLRQSRFAEANGLSFSSGEPDPGYPGAIFGYGGSRRVDDHYYSTSERYLDFGNYHYTTGSGKNRSTHRWGFLAMRLDRSLPHMLLDSTGNNGLFGGTNLPTSFQRDQVLSLEGDFDRYFRLYCPSEYERDALYVFTPDLMALLIDNAAQFDVEIIDDWMFVYSSSPFAMDDPATIDQLLMIVDTVGAKTLSQTDRYLDDRSTSTRDPGSVPGAVEPPRGSPAPSPRPVASGGRRLRRRFPIAGVAIVIVGFVGFQVARVVFDWL